MTQTTIDSNTLLNGVRDLVANDFQQLDQYLQQQLQSKIPFIQEVIKYIINSGGKRLRPLLVILSARAAGYLSGDEHLELATVIEFIHTATLLHDDVVDESKLRRGKETANSRWGNQSSILVGDFLYSRSFQVLAQRSNVPVMKVLAHATNVIAEGEVLQLLNIADLKLTESRYLDIIRSKTAMLFESASHIGALIGSTDKQQTEGLRQYGQNLGIAFQITDDVLDYTADQETLGKSLGDDLAEGKLTLPIIYALQGGSAADKQLIATIIQQDESAGATQLQQILQVLAKTSACDQAMQVAKRYTQKALTNLQTLSHSNYRQALEDLANFAVLRTY